MAYIKTLRQPCKACKRAASNELFNEFNASLGVYCRRCTGPVLRAQIKREKKLPQELTGMILTAHRLQGENG